MAPTSSPYLSCHCSKAWISPKPHQSVRSRQLSEERTEDFSTVAMVRDPPQIAGRLSSSSASGWRLPASHMVDPSLSSPLEVLGLDGKSRTIIDRCRTTVERRHGRVVEALRGGRSAGAVHGSRSRKSSRMPNGKRRPSGNEPQEHVANKNAEESASLVNEPGDVDIAGHPTAAELSLNPYGDPGEEEGLESDWECMEAAMDDRQRYMLDWSESFVAAEKPPGRDDLAEYAEEGMGSPFKKRQARVPVREAEAESTVNETPKLPASEYLFGDERVPAAGTVTGVLRRRFKGSGITHSEKEGSRAVGGREGCGPVESGRQGRSGNLKRRGDRRALEWDSGGRHLTVRKVQRRGLGYLVLQMESATPWGGAAGREPREPKGVRGPRGDEGKAANRSAEGVEQNGGKNAMRDGTDERLEKGGDNAAEGGVSTQGDRRARSFAREGSKSRLSKIEPYQAAAKSGVAAQTVSILRDGLVRENRSTQTRKVQWEAPNVSGKQQKDLILTGAVGEDNSKTGVAGEEGWVVSVDSRAAHRGSVREEPERNEEQTTEKQDELQVAIADGDSSQMGEQWEMAKGGKRAGWVTTAKGCESTTWTQESAEKKAQRNGGRAEESAEKKASRRGTEAGELAEEEAEADGMVKQSLTEKLLSVVEGEPAGGEEQGGDSNGSGRARGGMRRPKGSGWAEDKGGVAVDPKWEEEEESRAARLEPSDYGSAEISEILSLREGKEMEARSETGAAPSGKKKTKKKEEEQVVAAFEAPEGRSLVMVRLGQLLLAGAGRSSEPTAVLVPSGSLVAAAGRGWLAAEETAAQPEVLAAVADQLRKTVDQVKGNHAERLRPPVVEAPMEAANGGALGLAAESLQGHVAGLGRTVADALPAGMVDRVGSLAEKVGDTVSQMTESVSDNVELVTESVVDSVSDLSGAVSDFSESVSETVSDVADSLQEKVSDLSDAVQGTVDVVQETMEGWRGGMEGAVQEVGEQVQGAVEDFLLQDADLEEDELESFAAPDLPEFRGRRGMVNFLTLQDGTGLLSLTYDLYIHMLKVPFPIFAAAMFLVPLLLSVFFTLLYLPDIGGLALEETAAKFLAQKAAAQMTPGDGILSLQSLSWFAVFQVYMFSLALSTGLQPELAPLSPYTLLVANLNALVAQLIFVFLSGAVFARLSQPSQPVKCSQVAVICPPSARRRYRGEVPPSTLMCRYVLTGPQPSELVDVKVDLTFKFNTATGSGAFFRAQQSLKLLYHGVPQVRPEIAYQIHGMLVRHVIDESSPLFRRTLDILKREDAIFSLSVVGLERSSMQSVFHVEHYSVVDGDVIWNAEFEDMLVINKKNRRIIDQRKLSAIRMLPQ